MAKDNIVNDVDCYDSCHDPDCNNCLSNPEAVIHEVIAERRRQDGKWGGPEHDDEHEPEDFSRFIRDYVEKSETRNRSVARKRLIQVAALAIAAVQSDDRRLASNS